MHRVIFACGVLLLSASMAHASDNTIECARTPSGGERCTFPDGRVTERTLTAGGREKTTSTDPSLWGSRSGDGTGWTAPDSHLTPQSVALGVRQREGQEDRRERRSGEDVPGRRSPHPDGTTTTCAPDNGKISCRRR